MQGVTLDQYISDHGIAQIDFIKIDIEGAEVKAFKGMTGILSSDNPPYILCEVNALDLNAMGTSVTELREILADFGYVPYELSSQTLTPITLSDSDLAVRNIFFSRTPMEIVT